MAEQNRDGRDCGMLKLFTIFAVYLFNCKNMYSIGRCCKISVEVYYMCVQEWLEHNSSNTMETFIWGGKIMIRKLTEDDRKITLEFLSDEPAINLFIIGDIECFGFNILVRDHCSILLTKWL